MRQHLIDLSVIIVNYNGHQDLHDCLQSLFSACADLSFEVLAVDNHSTDGSAETIRINFPQVRLVENKENVGFARANNQAISLSRGRYLLLLNPDTVVLSDAPVKLISFMDSHPDAGMAGCKLLNPDGSIQYSMRNFPNLINQLSECFFLHHIFPRVDALSEMTRNEKRYEITQRVDWVCGAAMIVRRAMVEQVGAFDEDYFLFSEEKDWCYRAGRAGWQTYFYADGKIIHRSSEYRLNQALFVHLTTSRLSFFKKHKGKMAFVYRGLMRLYLRIRIVLLSLGSLTGRGQHDAGRLKTYRYCVKLMIGRSPNATGK